MLDIVERTEKIENVINVWESTHRNLKNICREFEISETTFRKYLTDTQKNRITDIGTAIKKEVVKNNKMKVY